MSGLFLALKLFAAFIIRYFAFAGTAFLIFYIFLADKIQKNKIQKSKAEKKDFRREVLYSLQTNVVFLGTALLILISPLKDYTQIYQDIHEFPMWYLPISFVLALIIHDTYFYWMHRILHGNWLYKKFHKVHHLSTNPSPWASFAFHFGEAIFESAIILIVVFAIPIHPFMILAFTLASLMINVYGHLGYEIVPKWYRKSFLFEILNSSVHHNMHHQYFKGNFGLYFRVWDRIMGTENPNYVKEYDELQEQRFGTKA
jgi:sterol desaturase/sphingolipid hydroxylase (fatty acid hydroxylase superfamily)